MRSALYNMRLPARGCIDRGFRALRGSAHMPDAPADFRVVCRRLEQAYGRRQWHRWGSAVSILVETVLSQNTSDRNSSAAFRKLWRTFRSWKRVADAATAEVERCIRVAGLSRIKAPRIQRILRAIRQHHGSLSLEFLGRMPPDEALEYLLKFDGVGHKTASCVLLFAFGKAVFPVDTHIHRIALRAGWIPARTTADRAHQLMQAVVPPDIAYSLHVLLIAHGRQTCLARRPLCDKCVLQDLCRTGRSAVT